MITTKFNHQDRVVAVEDPVNQEYRVIMLRRTWTIKSPTGFELLIFELDQKTRGFHYAGKKTSTPRNPSMKWIKENLPEKGSGKHIGSLLPVPLIYSSTLKKLDLFYRVTSEGRWIYWNGEATVDLSQNFTHEERQNHLQRIDFVSSMYKDPNTFILLHKYDVWRLWSELNHPKASLIAPEYLQDDLSRILGEYYWRIYRGQANF